MFQHPEAIRRPGYYAPSGQFMGFDSEGDDSDMEMDPERAEVMTTKIIWLIINENYLTNL